MATEHEQAVLAAALKWAAANLTCMAAERALADARWTRDEAGLRLTNIMQQALASHWKDTGR